MEKYTKKRAYARGKLKRFLDEKGVYKQFAENCKRDKYNKYKEPERPFKEIRSAFTWFDTKEGYGFWYNLSKEYDEQT